MFFDSYEALKVFFVQALKWEDEEDSLLPDLKEFDNFVLYANPKGLLIGPDVASYFADKHNPLYSAEEAEEEAYELFCEEGLRMERLCFTRIGILWPVGTWESITKGSKLV